MAFQVSPGVEVKEIDLTNVIPAVSTSIGGFAGRFRWGPIEQVALLSSENELANRFGKPNDQYARSFYEAASFLQYGEALKTVRANENELMNASSGALNGAIEGVTVDASLVAALNSISAGSDILENFTITGGTGSGAELSAAKYVVDTVALSNAGVGYEEDDIVSITLGGKTLQLNVEALDAASSPVGDVESIRLTNASALVEFTPAQLKGLSAGALTNVTTTLVSGAGTGEGLTVDVTFKLSSVAVTDGGVGYTTGQVVYGDSEIVTGAFAFEISDGTGADRQLVKNDEHFESSQSGMEDDVYSRYAGSIGNKTRVYIVNHSSFASNSFVGADGGTFDVAGTFDQAPDLANELHILVTTTAKEFTGDNSELTELVVENWPFLGVDSTAKSSDGSNNYYVDVINARSQWVYIPSDIAGVTTADAAAGTYSLGGGTDGTVARNDGLILTALDLLSDAETEDVNLIFTESDSAVENTTLGNAVLSVATGRKDAVAFVSPPVNATKGQSANNALDNVNEYKSSLSAPDSYGVIGSTSLYMYDKYNDKFISIGSQGHLAGLCANTDTVADAWFSPAGFNRGNLRNVAKVDFNANKVQRDSLYKNGINPIVAFPGQGIVLFGDKTLQSKPSAFDRINVRRLFIVLEKAIATAAKYQLFELNDEFTRATFRNAVEPFLRDVQGRRGITDFLVICDATNNTGQVIDTNRFVADIFIKPARSINFITLNFIATRTGVDFSEVVGLTNA